MKKIFYTKLVITILFLCGFSFHANALTISPARLELSADPGQTISGEFLLINEQEDTKTFYSSTANFEAQGETGTPTFISGKGGLGTWINLVPDITLKKGEQIKVPFSITIPQDADSGGHFAAIFLSTAPNSSDKGQVSIGAKIGVLVLLRVSGDIKEGGGIVGFDTKNNGSFYTALPIDFVYRFNNSGNDRVNPTGNLTIKNIFGFKSAQVLANESQGNILPGSTRRFDVTWGADPLLNDLSATTTNKNFILSAIYEWKHFAFGRYKASLNLNYGNNGKAEESKIVYVVPWHLLIVLTVVAVLIITMLSLGIKRYNSWIIKKAKSAQ